MTLLGCASLGASKPEAVSPPEPVVVVREVRETPPAELTRCPTVPRGLPTDGQALIPPEWRAGIGRLATSHGRLLDQVTRLLAWHGVECS